MDDSAEICRDCRAELEHCHGTLIDHRLWQPECTEAGCTDRTAPHEFTVDCIRTGCGCAVSLTG